MQNTKPGHFFSQNFSKKNTLPLTTDLIEDKFEYDEDKIPLFFKLDMFHGEEHKKYHQIVNEKLIKGFKNREKDKIIYEIENGADVRALGPLLKDKDDYQKYLDLDLCTYDKEYQWYLNYKLREALKNKNEEEFYLFIKLGANLKAIKGLISTTEGYNEYLVLTENKDVVFQAYLQKKLDCLLRHSKGNASESVCFFIKCGADILPSRHKLDEYDADFRKILKKLFEYLFEVMLNENPTKVQVNTFCNHFFLFLIRYDDLGRYNDGDYCTAAALMWLITALS